MIKRLLDHFWPLTPWVEQLTNHMRERPEHFTPVPFATFSGGVVSDGVICMDEDPYLIVCKVGAFRALGVKVVVPQTSPVGVVSMFCPEGYKLNWRERRIIEQTAELWKNVYLELWWAENQETIPSSEWEMQKS